MRHTRHPTAGLRAKVYERDRGICAKCDHDCSSAHSCHWEVDHILPRHLGGTDDLDNLQTLCVRCHHRKSRNELRRRKRRGLKRQMELRVIGG